MIGQTTVWVVLASATCFTASAQEALAQPSGNQANTVTLVQTVEPSFRIEPVVRRFVGRRGEIIPFEFLVTSTGRQLDVVVSPVGLRQEESGVILYDAKKRPSGAIRIQSPLEFKLAPGRSHTIRGQVVVPLAKTNYLSSGILVRDKGQMPQFESEDATDEHPRTKAGVRFVTQYVLRVDIETDRSADHELRQLRFEEGRVRSVQGNPVAETLIVNPTDYSFEFQVRGRLTTAGATSRPEIFHFGMPSRANLIGDERRLVRMMPRSRLRLVAPVTAQLFPRTHTLHIGISSGRREVAAADFQIAVSEGDFPAVESQVVYLADRMTISPAYIDLGKRNGQGRMTAIRFTNNSNSPQSVLLDPRSFPGEPLAHLQLSTRSFTVKPGRSISVRAVMRSSKELSEPQYGRVRVRVQSQTGDNVEGSLPVALYYGVPERPQVVYSAIELVEQNGTQGFLVTARNDGRGFVPIHGQLEISGEGGRRFELAAGYGKWIDPGESVSLRFVPDSPLTPGRYQLALRLRTFAGQPPTTRTIVVQLDEAEPTPLKAVAPTTASNS